MNRLFFAIHRLYCRFRATSTGHFFWEPPNLVWRCDICGQERVL